MELIYNISNLDNVVHFFVLATPDNKVTTAPTTGRKVCGDKPSLDKDCKNACGNEPTEVCAKVSVHTKDNMYMCRRLFLLQAYRILVHQLQIWSKLFGSFPIHDNWEPDLYMYKSTCKEFFTRIYLSIYAYKCKFPRLIHPFWAVISFFGNEILVGHGGAPPVPVGWGHPWAVSWAY